MNRTVLVFAMLSFTALGLMSCQSPPARTHARAQPAASAAQVDGFEVHDKRRPQPPVVTPTATTQERAGKAPSDAIVLFDGSDLSRWKSEKGEAASWKVVDNVMEIAPRSGAIRSADEFADVQLHIEWMEPAGPTTRKSQGRGNSGVFLMGLYEVQILDNYQSETYADGSAGGVYGQYPPLVNACRPPGQWQTYDIVFHPPSYDGEKVVKPARETVFFNGLLVQDDVKLIGPTQHKELTKYPTTHPVKAPITLQDHGSPVRFRNIWVREIPSEPPPVSVKSAGENYYEKK